ncbi:MAG: Unknown protein [uncultured Sulfurovum sp.]|uniref:Uncharacterized protein n=1 Tax=uncultured Sulfurovum sp. TaxID=269237 RepID=A0A6S6TK12_9BACT|nr:MAG: Unknown protein [uncultured Sulfurovum sp.]
MKKQHNFILPLIITFSTFSMGEVHISILDNVVVSSDKDGNTDYTYVDDSSKVINSKIGTNIHINEATPRTKEESIIYYNKRISYYHSKIDSLDVKIKRYEEKIINKPKYKERYEEKIEYYSQKIDNYKNKIETAKSKIAKLKES